jgi:hypothetical protein
MTFILNCYGNSDKQYTLTMEADSIEDVEAAALDMGLSFRWFELSELIESVPDRRQDG